MTIMEEKMIPKNAEAPVPPAARTYGGFLKNNIREYGMLLSLVVIMGFWSWARGDFSRSLRHDLDLLIVAG